MKTKELRRAFLATIPVLTGYLFLGLGCGILLHEAGIGTGWAVGMSLFLYSGSMQYLIADLLPAGASLLTIGITTLLVNARHIFYGISMIDSYRDIGPAKPYLAFAMTDETYSLLCNLPDDLTGRAKRRYCFYVTALDHLYWIVGCLLGSLAGAIIPFSTEGIEFTLTALFITVFVEQWCSTKDHTPAIIGLGASAAALLLFGEDMLIPAMVFITVSLAVLRRFRKEDASNG